MASRFRKLGVTTLGACAGAAVAAWAINANDSPYKVLLCNFFGLCVIKRMFKLLRIYVCDCFVWEKKNLSNKFLIKRILASGCWECCHCNATTETKIATANRTNSGIAERWRVWCSGHWWWCHRCRCCSGLDHTRFEDGTSWGWRFC